MLKLLLLIAFGFIVAEIARAKGYVRATSEPKEPNSKKMLYITWWCCGAALFIVSIIWVLVMPNMNKPTQKQIPQQQPTQRPATSSPATLESELTKYKDLFDKGLITQEEYEAKKAQLLNLK